MALLAAMWAVVLELAPWLLLGAVAAGLLHVLLPDGFVRRHLGGRGDVVKAVALGVLLPLCSCGVIPTALGLRRDGASRGATVGFLISTPQTGVDSTLVAASFFGWPFAALKLGTAAVTGLVGGWLANANGGRDPRATSVSDTATAPVDRSVRGALDHALEVLRSIWGWLVFGIVVSAVISVLVPPAVFEVFTGGGAVVALLAVLVLSIPLYVCATASVPIAAALVAGGFPPGAALVFLMAGPATNAATLGAVHRALGSRVLAIYLSTIVVGSMAAALLFQGVLSGVSSHVHAHGDHATPLAIASAVLLLGLIGWFVSDELRGRWQAWSSRAVAERTPAVELAVEGMTCGGCATRLRKALLAEDGVVATEVDHEAGRAVVHGTAGTPRLRMVVREAGFRPG
ncbi:MAG: permease [Deltaproteobacteria bacterium]|nr:permease [Deltaproteobacteria bacterium]